MNIQQFLETLAERVSASASVNSVYGEPVVVGNRTVIPLASFKYGFGFGGVRPKNGDVPGGMARSERASRDVRRA